MNRKMVQWLYQELPGLVDKGVIPLSVADSIRAYYGDVKGGDKKWVAIMMCSVMGALLIGLGIILLFAHNWEQISRSVRVVLSLLPLAVAQALALWVIMKKPASHAFKEGSAIFLSLMVGASIALIGQTYHIPGDMPEFLLTWMLLIVPLVYFLEATIPAVIYAAGMGVWACSEWGDPLKGLLLWPLLGLIVPHFIWALRQEKYALRVGILSLVMMLAVLAGAGYSLGRGIAGSGVVVYSSLVAGFYLLGVSEFNGLSRVWQRPLRVLGGVGVFSMMFFFSHASAWDWHHQVDNNISLQVIILSNLLTCMLIVSVLVFCVQYAKRRDWLRVSFGLLPLMAMVGFSVAASVPFLAMVLFNVYFLVVSLFWCVTGIKNGQVGLMNAGIFMLAALVLGRFFDSDIHFLIKGVVFILIGAGFLAANVIMSRRKGGVV